RSWKRNRAGVRRARRERVRIALDIFHRCGRPHRLHRQAGACGIAWERRRRPITRTRNLMTLLDRFRTQPQKDPDPAVRLAYLAELPLTERDQIVAAAREDSDARVRKAAVAKLLDPQALAAIARDDADESVRDAALMMLRDIALDAFEGVDESGSLAA